ncbi:hypothetical protein ACFV9D_04495 [Streptomyces sp. NPDC059875]|uniref:hypothetical protein n=1 Tax=unclassified Streptomyces TaxID=2593676 RepID=UPI00364E9295
MNLTSYVLHGKTAKSGSDGPPSGEPDGVDGFDGFEGFGGVEEGVADGAAGVDGGEADGLAGREGVAPGGTSSGPQAVRVRANRAATTPTVLRAPGRM